MPVLIPQLVWAKLKPFRWDRKKQTTQSSFLTSIDGVLASNLIKHGETNKSTKLPAYHKMEQYE